MGLLSMEDLLNPKYAFDIIKYDIKANKARKEVEKYQKRIDEKKAEEAVAKEAAENDIEHVDGEVVDPEIAALTNLIWNKSTNRYEFTTPKFDQSMFFNKDIIDAPFVEDLPELTYDDVENIISYVIKDIGKVDDKLRESDIRNTVLTILFLTNNINVFDMGDHFDQNATDTDIEINTVAKYLTNYKIFVSVETYDLEEFMTPTQLKNIVDSMGTKLNWTGNQDYIDIVKAIKEGSKNEKNQTKKVEIPNVPDPILKVPMDINSDIYNPPQPKIDHKVFAYLVERFGEILKDVDDFKFSIYPAIDNTDMNYTVRDIGQAIIRCTDMKDGSYCLFSIDLNTIVGNGFNLIVPSTFSNILQDIYVNIDKHPEIVKKLLTTNYKFSYNQSNLTDIELKSIIKDQLQYPVIYRYFDFSNMYTHMKDMSEEDKVKLANNLVGLTQLAWSNAGPGFSMPRFRFRSFKNPNSFILVSDKNVRVQSSAWMAQPYGLYAKQFISGDSDYESADSEFVLDFDNNVVKLYVDRTEIHL